MTGGNARVYLHIELRGEKTDRQWSLELHVGTQVDAKWEQTGLERSTCDRMTQDGFQKSQFAENRSFSSYKFLLTHENVEYNTNSLIPN